MDCVGLTAIDTKEHSNDAVKKSQQVNVKILNRFFQSFIRSIIAEFSDPIIDGECLCQVIQCSCEFIKECRKVIQ